MVRPLFIYRQENDVNHALYRQRSLKSQKERGN